MPKKKNSTNKKKGSFNFPHFENTAPAPKNTPSNSPMDAQNQANSAPLPQANTTQVLQPVVENVPEVVEVQDKREVSYSPARNNFEDNEEDKENAIVGKTVFDDPENYTIKYPLKNRWTFWFDKPTKNKVETWGDHLEKIYTFGYIEDFWG
jgi:E3 ubiquitin-protein ligase DOA10